MNDNNEKNGLRKLLGIALGGLAVTGLAITICLINIEEVTININNGGTEASTPSPEIYLDEEAESTDKPSASESARYEDFDANVFIKSYLSAMTSAINNGNFDYVSDFLYEKSKPYNDQKSYIEEYCTQHEIKETVISVDIVSEKSSKNKVVIDTRETYDITSKVNGKRTSSLLTSYTIERIDNTWLITEIINKTSENLVN